MSKLWARMSMALASGVSLLGAGLAPVNAQAPQPGTFLASASDQIVVRFRDGRAPDEGALGRDAGMSVRTVRQLGDGAWVLKLPARQSEASARAISARFAARTEVAYAEPDAIAFPTLVPNDTLYGSQWDFSAPVAGSYGANLPGAWDISTGSAGVVVAIVDTGYRPHADLAGRFVQGYDFIGDSLVANDGGGRDSDASDPGDWITSAENLSGYFAGCGARNSSWHGTHVAGTIGALSNNGAGVTGINWVSKIVPARVLGKCGGYVSDIADAIRWSAGLSVSGVPANANPARVINMSLGGSGACLSTYQNAIDAATTAGAIVVVAAGNSNSDASGFQPANCANVITVASTGPTGSRAYYSNYGATVEIAAPGGDSQWGGTILSTLNAGTTTPGADSYAYYQGTSMATPHVVGVVSLMLSVAPSLNFAQVVQILQNTATPFPAGSSCTAALCGPGILNAAGAVAQAAGVIASPPGAFAKTSPANGATNQATGLTLAWGSSAGASSYQYCVSTTSGSCATWISAGAATSAAPAGLASNTTYYWQVRATNGSGTTEADAGAWSSFTTQAQPLPGAFNKSSPSNGQTRRSIPVSLSWGASSGVTRYEYCVDTSNNNTCDGTWVSTGTTRSASVSGLASATTYYWQVRAVNAGGTTNANGGTWWRFTTR